MSNDITQKTASQPQDPIHVEKGPSHITHLNDVSLDDKGLNNEAHEGTNIEHSFGVWQGLKTYKRAAFWSIRELFFENGTYVCKSSSDTSPPLQSSQPRSLWRVTTSP